MMNFEMNCPTPIVFGPDSFERLADLPLPGKKALIVYSDDNIAVEYGYLHRLLQMLEPRNIGWRLYNNVQPNPVVDNVMSGAMAARESGCDFIIALGGGSVMDCAKAISLMATNEGDYWDYVDEKIFIQNPRLPVVTVSTLAGTGTEVAPCFCITNEERCEKVGFPRPARYNTWPVLAIVDPKLMTTVPPTHTAYSGFDAFSHCAESLLSKKSNYMSDLYSFAAISAFGKSIVSAVKNGGDLEARTQIAFASLCSGMVMTVGSCISKHPLEHGMSAYHNELPHGAGLLMICRAYYKKLISRHVLDDRFTEMARALGRTDASGPEDFIDALDELMQSCGVADLKMSDYGITPDEFPKFVHNARTTVIGHLFKSDVITLSDQDCIDIYTESYR